MIHPLIVNGGVYYTIVHLYNNHHHVSLNPLSRPFAHGERSAPIYTGFLFPRARARLHLSGRVSSHFRSSSTLSLFLCVTLALKSRSGFTAQFQCRPVRR